MATNTQILPNTLSAPPLRAKNEAGEYLYFLYYRQGNTPFPEFALFYHKSTDIRIVSQSARQYCESRNWRYQLTRPAFVDVSKPHGEGEEV